MRRGTCYACGFYTGNGFHTHHAVRGPVWVCWPCCFVNLKLRRPATTTEEDPMSAPLKPVATVTKGPQGDGVARTVNIMRGRSTSEFGVTVGAGVLAAVVTAAHVMQVIPGPWPLIGTGILAGLAALGYSVSRGITKAAAIRSIDR